ncbi:M17 family peptidase N-terminal domain-containing protein [Paraburkholderia sediminicola]|uniref:M17 family peptidase N-terminal domain-containing protein n=1 Tax=Paraburkholderia sediminicola TaxID=458836 RepID=UPI0038BDFEC1
MAHAQSAVHARGMNLKLTTTKKMQFTIKRISAVQDVTRLKADCIVIGVYQNAVFTDAAQAIDSAAQGLLTRLANAGDLDGKPDTAHMLHEVAGIGAARVLVVGLGKHGELDARGHALAVRCAARALSRPAMAHVAWTLTQEQPAEFNPAPMLRDTVVAWRGEGYRFDRFKTVSESAASMPRKITLTIGAVHDKVARGALREGEALADGIALTRDRGAGRRTQRDRPDSRMREPAGGQCVQTW